MPRDAFEWAVLSAIGPLGFHRSELYGLGDVSRALKACICNEALPVGLQRTVVRCHDAICA